MPRRHLFSRGFSALEMMIVVVIIAILAVLAYPVYSSIRARAQRAQCTANLRSLYLAAQLHVQQNNSWPQISMANTDAGSADFAQQWIDALTPQGVTRKTWICPTIQQLMQNPDYSTAQTARIDYVPMPFDDKPMTPHQWRRQPWFVETGDVHGNGNLIVFTDGSISDLKTVVAAGKAK